MQGQYPQQPPFYGGVNPYNNPAMNLGPNMQAQYGVPPPFNPGQYNFIPNSHPTQYPPQQPAQFNITPNMTTIRELGYIK